MTVDEQVKIIETQMNEAGLLLFERLAYIEHFIKPDEEFSDEAIEIVIGNMCHASQTDTTE